MQDEAVYWSAWARIPGCGARRLTQLSRYFGSLKVAWQASEACLRDTGIFSRAALSGVSLNRSRLDPMELWERDLKRGLRIVTRVQPDYPARFWHLPDPPGVIWVRGQWPLPEEAVAIVGTREASPYGERQARHLGRELAQAGVLVVSGAASGIDRAAHDGALEQGWTAAILGCGLDHVYPARHRALYRRIAECGALISEFPPDVPPQPGFFPLRNRLIAALAHGVVVVEARKRSGSLITADLALELGREVFAVPGAAGEPGSEGPHALLRAGAALAESACDVLDTLGWPHPEDPRAATGAQAMPLEQARVCEFLGDVPVPFDVLAGQTGFAADRLGALLTALELEGAVRVFPGGRYARG